MTGTFFLREREAMRHSANWGQHSIMVSNVLLNPAAHGSNPSGPKKFHRKKLSIFPRKVNSGLKMQIGHI